MPGKAEKKDIPEEEVEEDTESDEEDEESEEEDTTLNNTDVVQKYKIAAGFCNQALETVLGAIKVGASVVELCELGDATINQLVGTVFNKKKDDKHKVDRGVAFPTCINVNAIVCHNAPTSDEKQVLADGDVVRVDLGVHIDGYPVVAAHTVIVQAEEKPLTGKQADAYAAAQQCLDVAIKGLRPGGSNQTITELWGEIAEAYGVNLVEGVLSHQLKRYVIDGNDVIISKATVEHKVEDYEFETAQAWSIDVVLSTGPGKLKEGDQRPHVYKRAPDQQYLLKTQSGRVVLNEINTRFQNFPFTVRALESRGARLGVAEAMKHDLLVAYPVLGEKSGETVVQLKSTVLVTAAAIEKVTGRPLGQKFETDKKVESEKVKAALALGLKLKANKKNKNKKKKKAGAAAGGEAAAPAK